MEVNRIYHGDCLALLRRMNDESVNCVVTSPPYWGLRDYGIEPIEWPEVLFSPMPGLPKITIEEEKSSYGLEKDVWSYVGHSVLIFREIRRVLKNDGTVWLNLCGGYSGGGNGAANNPESSSMKQISSKGSTTAKGRNCYVPPSLKPKDLNGTPWRTAFALQSDGWFLRQDIIWSKLNPMPESVTDRCTKAHEYVFLLSKSAQYYFDHESIKEQCTYDDPRMYNDYKPKRLNRGYPGQNSRGGGSLNKAYSFARKTATEGKPGAPNQHREDREQIEYYGKRNKRSVWTVATYPYKKAHFATFPPKLIEPCILAGCPKHGVVLDPFMGSGTTGYVARENNRNYVGFELNPEYIEIAKQRIKNAEPSLF